MRERRNRMQELWLGYRHSVIPDDAPNSLLYELRCAFYMGAMKGQEVIFKALAAMEKSSPATEELQVMKDLEDELAEFSASIKGERS